MQIFSSIGIVLLLTAVASAQEEGGESTEDVTEVVAEDTTDEVVETEQGSDDAEVIVEEVSSEEVVSEEPVVGATEVEASEAEDEALTNDIDEVVVNVAEESGREGLDNVPEDAADGELQAFVTNQASAGVSDVEAMLARFRQYVKPEVEAGMKLAAVRSLASVRDERSLPLILEFAASMDPMVLSSTSVRETFGRAIVQQLQECGNLTPLDGVASEVTPETQSILAMAVARSGVSGSVGFLVTLLGDTDQMDALFLREIEVSAKLNQASDAEAHEESLRAVRGYLERGSSDLCRAAIAALGSLHDRSSIPALIQRLADEDSFVSRSARSSLTMMARTDLGQDPAIWQAWYEEQTTWWSETAPSVILILQSEDPAEAHKSLAALLEHPLWRHDLAEVIGPLALRADRPIAPAACVALGRLGSRRAIPFLLDAILSDKPEIRDHANAALRSITGLDLDADYIEWSRALGV